MRNPISRLLLAAALLASAQAHAEVQIPLRKPVSFEIKKAVEPAVKETAAPVVKEADAPAAQATTIPTVTEAAAPAVSQIEPAAAPVDKTEKVSVPPPKKKMQALDLEADVPTVDVDENLPLPPYPPGARTTVGKMQEWETGEEDTLLDIARHFDLGFIEARAANPELDAWSPAPGDRAVIPSFHLLPRARQDGIVVNLAEMRLYYFRRAGEAPETFPIGIGRDGLLTPLGETQIERKVAGPTWIPTERMRKEMPWLPASVPPGPENPLGTHALYLGWQEVRIHGSNKPWAIGRRVSSGCMRMYPEDIIRLFDQVPVGTKVTVVEQPILVAWADGDLYIEAHPSRIQSNDLEITGEFKPKEMTDAMRKNIIAAAGQGSEGAIDWDRAEKAVRERLGYPVVIAGPGLKKAPREERRAAATRAESPRAKTQRYND
jgi:L,D-transpeptidase ErfK/SrfK